MSPSTGSRRRCRLGPQRPSSTGSHPRRCRRRCWGAVGVPPPLIHCRRTMTLSIRRKKAPPSLIHCRGAPLPSIHADQSRCRWIHTKGGQLRWEELATAVEPPTCPPPWRSAAGEGEASALKRGEGRRCTPRPRPWRKRAPPR
jgi:hypothetical protein